MKKGFSLAEILITLGIIGVVAAMTIPNLITTHQKKAAAVQLKEAYAILTNAVQMANNDDELVYTPPESYGQSLNKNDEYGIFAAYFAPYMKGISKREKPDVTWSAIPPNGGTNAGVGYFGDGCYCLNNGMCFRLTNYFLTYIYLLVDLNGKSGPNRIGKDVFYFALHFVDNGISIDGNVFGINAQTPMDVLVKKCGKESSGWDSGSTCTEIIKRNNWEIPSYYPW